MSKIEKFAFAVALVVCICMLPFLSSSANSDIQVYEADNISASSGSNIVMDLTEAPENKIVISSGSAVVDERLYLSDSYFDKDINDIYSILLSIRNLLLLFLMIYLLRFIRLVVHSAFEKLYKHRG